MVARGIVPFGAAGCARYEKVRVAPRAPLNNHWRNNIMHWEDPKWNHERGRYKTEEERDAAWRHNLRKEKLDAYNARPEVRARQEKEVRELMKGVYLLFFSMGFFIVVGTLGYWMFGRDAEWPHYVGVGTFVFLAPGLLWAYAVKIYIRMNDDAKPVDFAVSFLNGVGVGFVITCVIGLAIWYFS